MRQEQSGSSFRRSEVTYLGHDLDAPRGRAMVPVSIGVLPSVVSECIGPLLIRIRVWATLVGIQVRGRA